MFYIQCTNLLLSMIVYLDFRQIDKIEKGFLPIFCPSHSLIDCINLSLLSLDSQLDKCLQDFYGRGLQNKKPLDNCIPSAPPFVGSESDLEQTSEQILTLKAHGTPSLSYSSVSATTNSSKESRNTTGHGIPNQSTRFVYTCFLHLLFIYFFFISLFTRSYW